MSSMMFLKDFGYNSIVLIFISLFFFSCGKDDSSEEFNFTPSPLLLKEKRINNQLHSSFKYYPNGQIQEAILYLPNTGIPKYKDSYTYGVDTTTRIRLDLENDLNVFTYKYYRVDDDQIRRDDYDYIELIGYRYYNFKETSNCGYSSILTYNSFGQLGTAVDFDFTDENCSATISVSPSINNSYLDSEFTKGDHYDAHNSTRIPLLGIGKLSNIESYIDRNESEEIIHSRSFRSEYVFNDQNHPVTEIRTYLDGIIEERTFIYY